LPKKQQPAEAPTKLTKPIEPSKIESELPKKPKTPEEQPKPAASLTNQPLPPLSIFFIELKKI